MGSTTNHREPFRLHHVTAEEEGQTLAAIVKKFEKDSSWGQAKQKISDRYVQVNGNLCLDHARRVKEKEVVKIWEAPLPKPFESKDLRFAYVDAHLVIVEKPAGVTSVRHFEERKLSSKRRQLQPTLEELVPEALAIYLEKQKPRTGPNTSLKRKSPLFSKQRIPVEGRRSLPRVIAVHRLDRDTSGLMIFARTPQAAESLGKMFRKHSIDRRYLAVVHGEVASQTIESWLVRDVGDGRRGSTNNPEDPDAQHAITHIKSLERLGDYSILECRLETGRTHQIRIHLSEIGHRLCGETLYNRSADGAVIEDQSGAPRQALHSSYLHLPHPITREPLEFKMPWPSDLHRWLRKLRK